MLYGVEGHNRGTAELAAIVHSHCERFRLQASQRSAKMSEAGPNAVPGGILGIVQSRHEAMMAIGLRGQHFASEGLAAEEKVRPRGARDALF
jgi:hypothetical protein